MNERVQQLRAGLEEPFLVTAPANVVYLSGFESSNAALLVEPDRVRLFTDFRYAEAADRVEGVEVEMTKRALYADLAERLEGRVAFEADAVTYGSYETLAAGGLDLVPRRGVVEELRAVKDEGELDSIRRACAISDEMFARLAEEPFVGRTEAALVWRIEELFHELGAEAVDFAHVAAGANGAVPHAHPGEDVVEAGATVVIDVGCRVDGYVSDCTRTFATGPLPDRMAEAYRVCLEAQLAGLEAVHAGVSGRDADAAARDIIDAAGFGELFGHGLGHGVGLLVHESPRLSQESSDVLAAGNVASVEPGIYLPGLGGVRIEDLVVVTDGEPEILTSFTKELVTVS